jgi:hypothetical protein
MGNKLDLSGFAELKAELAALPATLRAGSAPILQRHARDAAAAVVRAYPEVTGTLKAGVKVIERQARGIATLYTVATTARHAHFVEFGTVRTRAQPIFLPITARERRASVVAVAAGVEAEGLEVRGARD